MIRTIEQNKLELLWRLVQKPGRYTGGEWNEQKKDPEKVRFKMVLAFPEVYEIGLSYLGQKILYHLVNAHPEFMAERVYAPWVDFEQELRKRNIPLYSLENKIPLAEFDLIGFSLLYELNYSNVLTILELGQVPLLVEERTLQHPLVVAGGPAALNPEPLADFMDLFVFGDGEEIIFKIINRYLKVKGQVKSREELLRSFTDLRGVYVPRFYRPQKTERSHLLIPVPAPGFPEKIIKNVLFPLEKAAPPEKVVVPNIRSVFDRLQLEVARGCPQNCRFCQATVLYFPYRERSLAQTVSSSYQGLKETGYEDLSFNALSVGDYGFLERAIENILPYLEENKISVSLPSLRPGKLSRKIVEDIVKIRKTGFTLVPEAGSERLRAIINKKISDQELLEAARYAFENGWRLLKLYFMIGLPGEKAEDLKAIIQLIGELVELGKKILGTAPGINLSVSSFIPKPHTPFQWVAMNEEKLLLEKQAYIKSNIRRWKKVELKEHPVKISILEAVFSRGDRRLGAVLREAHAQGARFDGWLDMFRQDAWEKAFDRTGVDYRQYLQAISPEAALPWDLVETGLKKSYLLDELKAAASEQFTPGCGERNCGQCLACLWPEYKLSVNDTMNIPAPVVRAKKVTPGRDSQIFRYRAAYQKEGLARFISHNDLLDHLERAFRRAEIKMVFSQGYHPKMLISHGPALPLGAGAKAEILEFQSYEVLRRDEFLKRINACLPSGIRFSGLKMCSQFDRPIFQDIEQVVYSLDLNDPIISEKVPGRDKQEEALTVLPPEYQEKVKVKLENTRLIFFVQFEAQKPIRIQEVIEKMLGVKNSVYALTREYLVFKDGTDSRAL
ncbi:MAG: TIGR03960 family B12-binding radical SAM protein [Candidatus Aminicenantes bacterium]|nr:TIGR03960 family B12-binding radical SAM protein [Candidatus Aminicenantes bacterium]